MVLLKDHLAICEEFLEWLDEGVSLEEVLKLETFKKKSKKEISFMPQLYQYLII